MVFGRNRRERHEKIFIISSNDWKIVTPTFRLLDSLNSLDNLDESHVKNILEKREIYKKDIDGLDRKFIVVSPSVEGNFIIIEGNKRAVALLSIDKLIGNQIYLGVSKKREGYFWARHSQ